jgi:hypothetical protein
MVDLPGGDGANEGFWRFQIRDKYGQWIKMGGSIMFDTIHPNFGPVKGHGSFEGGSRPGVALIKVSDDHPTVGGKTIEVPSEDFQAVKAIIPADSPGLAEAKKLDAADGKIANDQNTGIFKEYGEARKNAAEDTPLTDLGFDPEQEITVYRGVPKGVDTINPGDWVTTLPQLAKDYAGGGDIVSMKIKAKDLLTDPSSGEDAYTEEMVYRPSEEDSWDLIDDGVEGKGDSIVFDKSLTFSEFDIAALNNKRHYAEDPEMFSAQETNMIKAYTQSNAFKVWNRALRTKDQDQLSTIKDSIDVLDAAFANHGEVFEDANVYRGFRFSDNQTPGHVDWKSKLESLDVGDVLTDDAYMSTSNDPEVAFGSFGAGVGGKITDSTYKSDNPSGAGSLFWSIKLPKGSTAFGVPEGFGYHSDSEDEVILPRGSQLKVVAIRRVKQEDIESANGEPRYNYYLETELVGIDAAPLPKQKEIQVVEG